MFEDPIIVRGAREHNLKNISIDIPSQKLVVITGPSGSGKSSLAFDTIFAEGQRRYIESLSAYARQFMEQMSKPDLDYIDGLSPAVAIEQKTISSHPRSTVGTATNIYDFIRLLYARVGEIKDPETGKTLQAHSSDDILSHVIALSKKNKIQIFASVVRGRKGEFLREFEQWRRQGFSKVKIDGKMFDLHDPILLNKHSHHDIDILLDVLQPGKSDAETRIKDSMALADKVSEGWMKVLDVGTGEETVFSRKVASPISGKSFPDLEPRIFSFNSPYGMCLECRGVGFVEKKAPSGRRTKKEEEEDLEELFDDEENLVVCSACKGARLNAQSLCVFFGGKNIYDLCSLSCVELHAFLESVDKKTAEHPVTKRLLGEVTTRLKFLIDVGVGYLSLTRRSATLSGGEAQRIRLATQLGTQLSGVLYVLDEPSIGLHPRDQEKLLKSLKGLRDLGNTVLVVEHDEETMLEADFIIDIGPGAGVHGGYIVAADEPKKFLKRSD
jgi:excinuclease ABC subunit A